MTELSINLVLASKSKGPIKLIELTTILDLHCINQSVYNIENKYQSLPNSQERNKKGAYLRLRIERSSIAGLQHIQALIQLIEADNEASDGVEKPVEDEGGEDEEDVALALHDRFLVEEVL